MTVTICYTLLYVFGQTGLSKRGVSHQSLHCLPLIQLFQTQHWVVNSTYSNVLISMVRSWGVWMLRVNMVKQQTQKLKWSIISKSVTIIIFVDFIDQLINYPINCASLNFYCFSLCKWPFLSESIYLPRHTLVIVCLLWIFGYHQNAQRKLWPDCVDAQSDLSLHWTHMQYYGTCYASAHITKICVCTVDTSMHFE